MIPFSGEVVMAVVMEREDVLVPDKVAVEDLVRD